MPHYKHDKDCARARKTSNSTPGSVKGENCKASSLDRIICRRNRSYKMAEYEAWLEKTRRVNKGK